MREILLSAATLAAALILIAAAVFAGGDRSVLVPPPDALTESFVRLLTTKRFDLAMHHLARERQRAETPRTLETRFERPLAAVGKVNEVTAKVVWTRREQSAAAATVRGDNGEVSFEFRLVPERGLWKILMLE